VRNVGLFEGIYGGTRDKREGAMSQIDRQQATFGPLSCLTKFSAK
jgi:hypothetical protein